MDDFDQPSTCLLSTHLHHRLATVPIRDDTLLWIRRGCKTLIHASGALAIKAGGAVILRQGSQWDVINDPAPHGRYEAHALLFGGDALRAFSAVYGADFPGKPVDGHAVVAMNPSLEAALQRAVDTLSAPMHSQRITQHRVVELLILLAEQGLVVKPCLTTNWPDRVRRMIRQRPHADWSVETLAQAFHLSPSTLRRRLVEFDISASEMVREVRLESALLLLQSTEMAVGEIAQRCGYESHSRFSAVFRQRYGFTPSLFRQDKERTALHDSAQSLTHPG